MKRMNGIIGYRLELKKDQMPADCIKMSEVAATLKKMKKQKAQCFSGLAAQIILVLSEYWIYVMVL